MGNIIELNWYLVLSDIVSGPTNLIGNSYLLMKHGMRIYPVGEVVPLIQDDKAIGLVHIESVEYVTPERQDVRTHITYELIVDLNKHDVLQDRYTELYKQYKEKQESEDKSGKFELREYVNPLDRKRPG